MSESLDTKAVLEAAANNGGQVIEETGPTKVKAGDYNRVVRLYGGDVGRSWGILTAALFFVVMALIGLVEGYTRSGVEDLTDWLHLLERWQFWALVSLAGLVGYAGARFVAVKTAFGNLITQSTKVTINVAGPPAPAPTLDAGFITVTNSMGTAVIDQPAPAAFSQWLTAVIGPGRVEFSQNEAKARGWSDEQYKQLIGELRRIGWLQPKPDGNGVYRMTESGTSQAGRWLQYRAPQ